ncbi:LytTR family DNA-binding domain-containing protein [Duncaniella freteri]|uniref:LytR/AlgR family response regulator transcription factor n=1 Tax=Duncaniella freteri TaxID=2530391 RepID=UPI00256F1853|nr:LytTR family DNA-binding domain-containing protein [Duncaniella freteri]
MKCVAIDDEPIALSIIQEYCKRYGGIELQSFTSPVAGMECVNATRPDVVFLDIEMNSHNGVELARQMPEECSVIFTTAYAHYALDGFNVDAVDFLHKPIFYPRFERAMEKVKRYIDNMPRNDNDDVLTLKVEHKNVVVKFSEILYIEAMDNYVKIFRKGLPMVVSQITMKEMESRLSPDRFVRLHRSYIVSIADIEKFSNRQIYLRNAPRPIPVGRKYIDLYKDLNNCFILKNNND